MKKVIFLDRDGVINDPKDYYYVKNENEFHLNTHIISTLKEYSEYGYEFIIITNQGGVSKGLYSHQTLENIHSLLKNSLKKEGIEILEIYYCPHHEKNSNCICRKPNPLMIEKAIARFDINTVTALFIGDSQSDIESASRAGINGILIPKNGELPKISEILKNHSF